MGLLASDYVDSYGSMHPDAVAGGLTTLNPAYFDDLRPGKRYALCSHRRNLPCA